MDRNSEWVGASDVAAVVRERWVLELLESDELGVAKMLVRICSNKEQRRAQSLFGGTMQVAIPLP
jgi:hypothetical protein